MPEEILTVDEAAKLLQLHPRTVREWAYTGLIRHHPIGHTKKKKTIRFLRSELIEDIKSFTPKTIDKDVEDEIVAHARAIR